MIAIGIDDDGYREAIGAAEDFTVAAGVPAGVPSLAAVPRPSRRADDRRGQGGGHGRVDRGDFPRGGLPALHRALLPQRARPRVEVRVGIEALPGRGAV